MKKDILTLLAVVAVVAALGSYFMFAPEAPQLDYVPIDVGGGSITVEDQDQIDFVMLSTELVAPGFITIHETLATGGAGAPAAIVGTSDYLDIGVYENLKINLTEEMLPGYRYIALLHADNGDGIFVVNDDLPVEVDGTVVRPDFLAIPEAERTELPSGEVDSSQ
ncbi:MAG: hypothetical protein Q8P30_04090 [Candidatus Uhrbacteria bacterium]|nr:hypothetical protein [Candidatus Uhrbacteria bacterium]